MVPTSTQRSGDFSDLLDLTSPTGVLDCNGAQTYQSARSLIRGKRSPGTVVSAAFPSVMPMACRAMSFQLRRLILSGSKLINLFPSPNATGVGYNYLSDPITTQTANQGDARIDQVITKRDSFAFYPLQHEQLA